LKIGEKLLLFVEASLIVLSLLSLAFFVTLSAVSLVTWSVPHIWKVCFFLCAVSLSGWMLLYAAQLRIGGGVFIYRNNIILLFSLILAVLISAFIRFTGHQRYVAILVVGLCLAVFYIAVPLTPGALFRLLKGKQIAKHGNKS